MDRRSGLMPDLEALQQERRVFPVKDDVVARAHIDAKRYAELMSEAEADHEGFWAARAREELVWDTPFEQVLDDGEAPRYRWFADGHLNACVNVLDRHLPERAAEVALTWEAEDGEVRDVTWGELHKDVCRFAGVLRGLGVQTGDRVVLYMPLVPEVVVAMLACARIGAPHSVVFAGFSATALADRIQDTGAKVVVTADEGIRAGKTVPLKANTDDAVARCPDVERVVVLRRTGGNVPTTERDVWWHDEMAKADPVTEPVVVDAEHPLFICLLYTSPSPRDS